MTEDEARAWLQDRFGVSRETWQQLESFVSLILREMADQNLIARSTVDHIWARHIVDSAQLLAAPPGGVWVDLGSGAGLPGIVVAILRAEPMILVETRRKRAEFLQSVIGTLNLRNASVVQANVESWHPEQVAAIISARAFAPLPRLLQVAAHIADRETLWLLPKGRQWQNEIALAHAMWHFTFHVEHSATDGESAVLHLRDVRKKGGRKK